MRSIKLVIAAITVVISGCCCSSSTPGDSPKKVDPSKENATQGKPAEEYTPKMTEDGVEILPQPRVKE